MVRKLLKPLNNYILINARRVIYATIGLILAWMHNRRQFLKKLKKTIFSRNRYLFVWSSVAKRMRRVIIIIDVV